MLASPARGWRGGAGRCRTPRPCAEGRRPWRSLIPCRRADGPPSLPVDVEPVSATGSSEPARGIEFLGDGAWQVRKQGPQGRRRWRQGHRAMDAATSDIRALDTPGRDGDGPVLPDRLDPTPEQEPIGTVTAEGP